MTEPDAGIAMYTNRPALADYPQKPKDPEVTYPGVRCNCFRYVASRYGELPRMVDIVPNTDPAVGTVAIEWFGEIKHVSYVTEVLTDGVKVVESNYIHCTTSERFIPFNSHRLAGFWSS